MYKNWGCEKEGVGGRKRERDKEKSENIQTKKGVEYDIFKFINPSYWEKKITKVNYLGIDCK